MSGKLDWRPVAILLGLSVIWGANLAVVKLTTAHLAPLFMAGLRSAIAAVCLYFWMRHKGMPIWPRGVMLIHALAAGAFFAGEFGLIYIGLEYTTSSRTYVLLYTAPFFVALEAHFFLSGDRLGIWKVVGLVLAFVGVLVLFWRDMAEFSLDTLPGDIMALTAGFLWGTSTVYIKRYVINRVLAEQTLFYQLLFSIPMLVGLSLILESPMVSGFNVYDALSLLFQGGLVASYSYLIWFFLIRDHQVSLIHAFSFFTPVMGVFISGLLILGEPVGFSLVAALVLVSLGLVLVNR